MFKHHSGARFVPGPLFGATGGSLGVVFRERADLISSVPKGFGIKGPTWKSSGLQARFAAGAEIRGAEHTFRKNRGKKNLEASSFSSTLKFFSAPVLFGGRAFFAPAAQLGLKNAQTSEANVGVLKPDSPAVPRTGFTPLFVFSAGPFGCFQPGVRRWLAGVPPPGR